MNNFDPFSVAPASATVRLAYTLNNRQPVRCTYISEEPLFYLDQGVIDDDDLDIPVDLLEEFSACDPQIPSGPPSDRVDAARVFAEQFGGVPVKTPVLAETLVQLRQSRIGAALLDFALSHGVTIETAPQRSAVTYDRMNGAIKLRNNVGPAEQFLLLTRELRRVWQHRNGALIHPLLFHPDHAIVINRIHAADLMATMTRVAWEMSLAGDTRPWDYLEKNGHHDMTRALSREARTDFRALNNGRAMASVFEAWFLSERCRGYDRTLIQQMLADYQGYVFKAGHEETSKVLTQQLLASLGTLPFGKNYLSPHAATILADPIFTDIRDRSNANFLWFIKFEQSFRQTERDLQSKGGLLTSGTTSLSLDQSVHADHDLPAQVLQLPVSPKNDRSGGPPRRVVGSNDAVIIDLQSARRDRLAD